MRRDSLAKAGTAIIPADTMPQLYEPIDTLNTPYDAFWADSRNVNDPPRTHWHYYIELIYVEDGTLQADYDRRRTILHPGDLAVF